MRRPKNDQDGFSIIEGVVILAVIVIIGVAGFVVYRNYTKPAPVKTTTNTQTSTTTKPKTNNTPAYTAQDAVTFTQTTYDTYLAAVNKANSDSNNTQPVAQAGLAAVKDALSTDLYAKAAAVTQATPFSCTAHYVADKYTASLSSSDKTNAMVAVAISNGSGLTTTGMSATVDLTSLKITAVICPS